MPFALRAATALSLSLAALAPATAARAEFALTILHVNDFHSRVEAINRFDSTCSAADDAEGKCFGGMARLSTAVADARAAAGDAPILFLNAGDIFQGSLYYTTYKGLAEAELFNGVGVDAMALGNHEFDNGPETLAAFIDKVHFPVLSGNTWLGDEPSLKGKTQGYLILDVGGEKVGIVSALTTDTAVIASPGPNVSFSNTVRYLKTIVQEVEAQGVNKIIALTHVGVTEDIEIASAVPGIDAIIGGHSHTLMSNTVEGATPYPLLVKGPDGRDVPIAHAYAYGKYLGDLKITFDDAGAVIAARGEPLLLDASVAEDAGVKARIREMGAPIQALKNQIIGESTAPIDGDRANCRARVCAMGVLVSEAMLARTRDQGMQVAIQNGGGLRASIDAGPVTMGEVLTVLPFQNALATFTLTGALKAEGSGVAPCAVTVTEGLVATMKDEATLVGVLAYYMGIARGADEATADRAAIMSAKSLGYDPTSYRAWLTCRPEGAERAQRIDAAFPDLPAKGERGEEAFKNIFPKE